MLEVESVSKRGMNSLKLGSKNIPVLLISEAIAPSRVSSGGVNQNLAIGLTVRKAQGGTHEPRGAQERSPQRFIVRGALVRRGPSRLLVACSMAYLPRDCGCSRGRSRPP